MSLENRINHALNRVKDGLFDRSMPPEETDIDIVLIDALAEIKDLKQQLSEVHKSRASWVEYSQKIESGEFVLVPRDKIEILWQDDDEPENFVNKESDFDCLGDCIDLNEIMTINAHHQANLKTEKMYGTWFAEVGYPKEKANFHVGTHQECLDIIAKNKAMIEAVEKDS